jgi:hypothetical protein
MTAVSAQAEFLLQSLLEESVDTSLRDCLVDLGFCAAGCNSTNRLSVDLNR